MLENRRHCCFFSDVSNEVHSLKSQVQNLQKVSYPFSIYPIASFDIYDHDCNFADAYRCELTCVFYMLTCSPVDSYLMARPLAFAILFLTRAVSESRDQSPKTILVHRYPAQLLHRYTRRPCQTQKKGSPVSPDSFVLGLAPLRVSF